MPWARRLCRSEADGFLGPRRVMRSALSARSHLRHRRGPRAHRHRAPRRGALVTDTPAPSHDFWYRASGVGRGAGALFPSQGARRRRRAQLIQFDRPNVSFASMARAAGFFDDRVTDRLFPSLLASVRGSDPEGIIRVILIVSLARRYRRQGRACLYRDSARRFRCAVHLPLTIVLPNLRDRATRTRHG